VVSFSSKLNLDQIANILLIIKLEKYFTKI